MSKTTAMSRIPYPEASDPADIPNHLRLLAEGVDGRTVMRFDTSSARDAAITQPVAGMIAWLSTPGKHTFYTGTNWQPLPMSPTIVYSADAGYPANGSQTYVEQLADVPAGYTLDLTFTAPPSGRVIASFGAQCHNSVNTETAWMSINVYPSGSTTAFYTANDDFAVRSEGSPYHSCSVQGQISGLTPYASYKVVTAYRTTAAGNNAWFDNRFLRIDPIY